MKNVGIIIAIVVVMLVAIGGYFVMRKKQSPQRVSDLSNLLSRNPNFDPASGKTPAQISDWVSGLTDDEYKAITAFLSVSGSEAQKFAAAATALNITTDQAKTLITSATLKLN